MYARSARRACGHHRGICLLPMCKTALGTRGARGGSSQQMSARKRKRPNTCSGALMPPLDPCVQQQRRHSIGREAAEVHATAANAMLPPSAVVSASEPTRVDRILDALKCPICLNVYDDPTTLSGCVHTFCRKCITKHLRGIKPPYYSTCPECKKPATKRDCLPNHDLASVVQVAKRAL